MEFFSLFAYNYPIYMALLWMTGAFIFFLHRERREPGVKNPPPLKSYPPVSILIPCYNEEETIRDTLEILDKQRYPTYEVIAINDGSTDNTERILKELALRYRWLRIVNFQENKGKATALNIGLLSSKNEFLICVDADAMLDISAIRWMMYHFVSGPNVGAVTGNPRIRNRNALLSKIQIGEFSAIVGMIKRCHRIIGNVFTVSGVIAGFRKSAVIQAGLWDINTVTEDISISWKLQSNFWDIRFEPRALCMILMPETIKGLWKQRLRWAQGGMEVMLKNTWIWKSWRQKKLFILYIDYFLSVVWAYSVILVILSGIYNLFFNHYGDYSIMNLLYSRHAIAIVIVSLLQFGFGIFLDSRYEKGTGKFYYWAIWYPIAFWIINILTVSVGVIKAILRKKTKFATWESPDRGIEI